jgi:hypothetical protein
MAYVRNAVDLPKTSAGTASSSTHLISRSCTVSPPRCLRWKLSASEAIEGSAVAEEHRHHSTIGFRSSHALFLFAARSLASANHDRLNTGAACGEWPFSRTYDCRKSKMKRRPGRRHTPATGRLISVATAGPDNGLGNWRTRNWPLSVGVAGAFDRREAHSSGTGGNSRSCH